MGKLASRCVNIKCQNFTCANCCATQSIFVSDTDNIARMSTVTQTTDTNNWPASGDDMIALFCIISQGHADKRRWWWWWWCYIIHWILMLYSIELEQHMHMLYDPLMVLSFCVSSDAPRCGCRLHNVVVVVWRTFVGYVISGSDRFVCTKPVVNCMLCI